MSPPVTRPRRKNARLSGQGRKQYCSHHLEIANIYLDIQNIQRRHIQGTYPKTPISSNKGKTQECRRYIEYYQNWKALPLDHQGHVEAEQEGEGQPRVHLAAPPHQLLKRQLHLLGHREPEDDNSLSSKKSFLVLRQGELFIRISEAKINEEFNK